MSARPRGGLPARPVAERSPRRGLRPSATPSPARSSIRRCPGRHGSVPSHIAKRQSGAALSLRTTKDSYEPATGCARRFRFEPAEREPTSGAALITHVRQVVHCACARRRSEPSRMSWLHIRGCQGRDRTMWVICQPIGRRRRGRASDYLSTLHAPRPAGPAPLRQPLHRDVPVVGRRDGGR
jgi:hypothetical protein